MESILDIDEPFIETDAIKSYEYNEYLPTSGSNLNTPGTITIHIECQDEFYHPRRSYLLVEGDVVKENGTRYIDGADDIALTNNGIMHLFSNIKYEIAGQEIESVNNPGISGVIMNTVKFPYGYAEGVGLMQCWAADTDETQLGDKGWRKRKDYIMTKSDPKGSFSFIVELENVFGFVEDYDKVTYGMRQKLTLVRKDNNDALFRTRATAAGKVRLSKVAWIMPRVHPSDVKKFDLYRKIESKVSIDVPFRMRQCNITEIPPNVTSYDWRLGVRSSPEKPRHILIALQKDRSGDQLKNASLFDHEDLSEISVVLNDTKYPARDIHSDFKKHKYIEHYKSFTDFARDYYGLDPLTVGNFIDPISYKEEFPIFYINVSHQSERLSHGVVDIKVQMRFGDNTKENLVAHALIISDRRMKFTSDGSKMNIMY